MANERSNSSTHWRCTNKSRNGSIRRRRHCGRPDRRRRDTNHWHCCCRVRSSSVCCCHRRHRRRPNRHRHRHSRTRLVVPGTTPRLWTDSLYCQGITISRGPDRFPLSSNCLCWNNVAVTSSSTTMALLLRLSRKSVGRRVSTLLCLLALVHGIRMRIRIRIGYTTTIATIVVRACTIVDITTTTTSVDHNTGKVGGGAVVVQNTHHPYSFFSPFAKRTSKRLRSRRS